MQREIRGTKGDTLHCERVTHGTGRMEKGYTSLVMGKEGSEGVLCGSGLPLLVTLCCIANVYYTDAC